MVEEKHDENVIKKLVAMEQRIRYCRRCVSNPYESLMPALGKGELDPEILIVFESDGDHGANMDLFLTVRAMVKQVFQVRKIYHTFLLRCQTARLFLLNARIYTGEDQFDEVHNTQDFSYVDPAAVFIFSCLPFLVEEIDILRPPVILLCGDTVSDYVLKAYGFYEPLPDKVDYRLTDFTFLAAPPAEQLTWQQLHKLASLLT